MTYSATILADSPTFWYRLNESSGTSATDSSGNSNTGTYTASNVTYSVTGAILGDTDKAVTFASTGQLAAATGVVPSGSFSMECWYKTASNISAATSLMANYSSNGGFTATFGAGFAGSATNKINFSVANSSNGFTTTATTTISLNTWYHLVGTFDNTSHTLSFYVNGSLVGSNTESTYQAPVGKFYVGSSSYADNQSGSYDEAAVYSGTVLSSTRVAAHYTAGITITNSRTIPATAALLQTKTRTIPSTTALLQTSTRTIPATASLSGTTRTIPATAALLQTNTRTITSTAALLQTKSRTITTTAALLQTNTRTIATTAALLQTSTRTIPSTVALTAPGSIFYASNVASTNGGLTLSDQMSQAPGGTETSFTVTMPTTSTNSYVELLAQGGTSSGTSVIPAPTGKGWSISLSGNTIPSGTWSSAFTLAKSGTTMTGASLYVRWYRRTMDGTYYPIGATSLSSQSFSTTKTVYALPGVAATLWQFIAGDTLYMDAFVFNGATSWASAAFTVYVSNSSSIGVTNDGTITAPQMITTPSGLSCLVGVSNFQTGISASVLNQSFTLADALDQRSILNATIEDPAGTLSYTPAQPVMFSDSNQGLLYTGYLNSDRATKPAAGGAAQLEHQMTFADHHRDFDKRANSTNYLNWTAGDMVCDMVQQTLSQEGITGAFALESDYTPTTFAQGTLTGTVATTTTSPFVYAPNSANPPITSNTGDLELTRAGTQFTLTESTTADFASGTLTNMVASNNQLSPSTQSAIKVTALYSPVSTATNVAATESGGAQTSGEYQLNIARAQFWTGSMTVGTSDTFNYDIWISSTSPAFFAGIGLLFSDGTRLPGYIGTLDSNNTVGLFDQNGASVDILQDLSSYAKDTWYTRNIALTGLNGKTINGVYVYLTSSSGGTYTVYVKNCYLTSQSGSPFFSTTATATQTNPPTVTTTGGYIASTVNTAILQAYNPLASYRVSSAHSISSVGLVQNSTITWTASLPTSGTVPTPYPPGTSGSISSSSGGGAMVMLASYDGNAWLECQNAQALPGLPAGANVSGLSLYLREQFAAGSDPTAVPALLDVSITINSAANTTVSDIVATYGTSTQWNTGTQILTNPNSNGNLTLGGSANPLTRNWNDNLITNQTFLGGPNNSSTQAATGGAYTMTPVINSGGSWCQSRFDLAGYFQNGTIEADLKVSTTGFYCEAGIEYRQTGWGNANNNGAYYVFIRSDNGVEFGFGSNSFGNSTGSFSSPVAIAETIAANTFYHIKIVVNGNRHTVYFNNGSSPIIDILDNTYTDAGQLGFRCYTNSSTQTFTGSIDNLSVVTTTAGTWTSPSTSLSSLGTCGYSQVSWTDLDSRGQVESTTTVLASVDGGSTWQPCTNGAEVPQLARGTSTSGMSLVFQAILYSSTPPISTPVLMGLYARVCGNYGTVSGTRVSPALNLSPVGYVASSNAMYNANIPTNTSVVVASSQDASTWTTVGGSGAGAALSYWTNQPSATQDLFNTNTLANYTNTNKSGGSTAVAAYDTTNSRITLTGGSGALYLNNAISCADVDELVDMDESDAGGLVWRKVDASNYYELGVYDASSSGGFTNALRLYKVASGTRSLLGSASAVIFTRTTFHRIRVTMQGGLINVYWDGACVQSYLDTSPLAAGACGLRNDGGTSRYYQLWVQPLGTNLTGQALYTRVTMTTTDPSVMPQLFTLVACVRGPSIATGATIPQLHPVTTPFSVYYSKEMDTAVQVSGDYYWYVNKWRQLYFGPRLARPGAFPVQSVVDSANASGYLLYQPQVSVLSAADLYRNRQIITNVNGLVTPPPEIKSADGSTTSWTMGYPLYSAPTILISGQPATIGVQGIDSGRQFYWQPGSASISYDSTLPKLPSGTVLSFTYVGQSTVNVTLNNSANQTAQAALEQNSGIVDEIESALSSTAKGMTTDQATSFGNGLLSRFGTNRTIELMGTTLYAGLTPGTMTALFLPEMFSTWNAQIPIVKVTTTAFQSQNGLIYFYSLDATTGPSLSNWTRVFHQ